MLCYSKFNYFVICCRDDGLELRHWVKGYKDANGRIRDAQEGDYAFAKYNKKASWLLRMQAAVDTMRQLQLSAMLQQRQIAHQMLGTARTSSHSAHALQFASLKLCTPGAAQAALH